MSSTGGFEPGRALDFTYGLSLFANKQEKTYVRTDCGMVKVYSRQELFNLQSRLIEVINSEQKIPCSDIATMKANKGFTLRGNVVALATVVGGYGHETEPPEGVDIVDYNRENAKQNRATAIVKEYILSLNL